MVLGVCCNPAHSRMMVGAAVVGRHGSFDWRTPTAESKGHIEGRLIRGLTTAVRAREVADPVSVHSMTKGAVCDDDSGVFPAAA